MPKRDTYTRAEFVDRMAALCVDLLEDHEDHTGITATHEMSFEDWTTEVQNAEDNA